MPMKLRPTEATAFDADTFHQLIRQAVAATTPETAWLDLEAAHVVGQLQLGPHWQTHRLMLGLALRTRDLPEAAGQLLRLALVPLGHLSGRLPLGNPGRATVSAFEPMAVRPALRERIERARRPAEPRTR